jgi:hypothetical protein
MNQCPSTRNDIISYCLIVEKKFVNKSNEINDNSKLKTYSLNGEQFNSYVNQILNLEINETTILINNASVSFNFSFKAERLQFFKNLNVRITSSEEDEEQFDLKPFSIVDQSELYFNSSNDIFKYFDNLQFTQQNLTVTNGLEAVRVANLMPATVYNCFFIVNIQWKSGETHSFLLTKKLIFKTSYQTSKPTNTGIFLIPIIIAFILLILLLVFSILKKESRFNKKFRNFIAIYCMHKIGKTKFSTRIYKSIYSDVNGSIYPSESCSSVDNPFYFSNINDTLHLTSHECRRSTTQNENHPLNPIIK